MAGVFFLDLAPLFSRRCCRLSRGRNFARRCPQPHAISDPHALSLLVPLPTDLLFAYRAILVSGCQLDSLGFFVASPSLGLHRRHGLAGVITTDKCRRTRVRPLGLISCLHPLLCVFRPACAPLTGNSGRWGAFPMFVFVLGWFETVMSCTPFCSLGVSRTHIVLFFFSSSRF